MAFFGIAVTDCSDDAAVLKVLRNYTTESLASLRCKLRTSQAAVVISETNYAADVDMIQGHREQHAKIRRAISEIRAAGGRPQLYVWVAEGDPMEPVSEDMADNLFAAHIQDLQQEYD